MAQAGGEQAQQAQEMLKDQGIYIFFFQKIDDF